MALKADVDQGWDVDKDGNGILTTTLSTTSNNYYENKNIEYIHDDN